MKPEISLKFRNEDEGKNLVVTLDDMGDITIYIHYDDEDCEHGPTSKSFKVPDYAMRKLVNNLSKLQIAQDSGNML